MDAWSPNRRPANGLANRNEGGPPSGGVVRRRWFWCPKRVGEPRRRHVPFGTSVFSSLGAGQTACQIEKRPRSRSGLIQQVADGCDLIAVLELTEHSGKNLDNLATFGPSFVQHDDCAGLRKAQHIPDGEPLRHSQIVRVDGSEHAAAFEVSDGLDDSRAKPTASGTY
jgi:hypothetical protein